MSNKHKHGDRVPSPVVCSRIEELSNAIIQGIEALDREITMRAPIEMDRDADLILVESAQRTAELELKNKFIELNIAKPLY